MSIPSEEQIKLYLGGNYNTLADYFNRKIVRSLPYSQSGTQKVTVQGGNSYVILGADVPGGSLSGTLAVGLGTTNLTGGIIVSGGAIIGTASTAALVQGGSYLTLVDIRESGTNNEITIDDSGTRRKVWGLLQSSAADGAAITNSTPTPNLQMSLVFIDSVDGLTLTSISPTNFDIEFHLNVVYAVRHLPNFYKENSLIEKDVLDLSGTFEQIEVNIASTIEYPANSVITISTGNGFSGGTGNVTFNSGLTLPTSAPLFISDARVHVFRNGVRLKKGVDVVWDSVNSFHLTSIVRVGEEIAIVAPLSY